jgi:hypothetical protein
MGKPLKPTGGLSSFRMTFIRKIISGLARLAIQFPNKPAPWQSCNLISPPDKPPGRTASLGTCTGLNPSGGIQDLTLKVAKNAPIQRLNPVDNNRTTNPPPSGNLFLRLRH